MVREVDFNQIEMLRKMILIREFEEFILIQRKASKIYGPVHPYVGQEAVAVGVCSVLGDTDQIITSHRGHGNCIAKGADVNRMLAELYGRVDGYCKGQGGSMHITDVTIGILCGIGIVGGGLPIAAGAALAAKLEARGDVVVCFFGDGAAGQGVFHEALNFASIWQLPLIFVCENNGYADAAAVTELRVIPDISSQAAAYAMHGASVDGNDVIAVFEVAREAAARARNGEGPTLINCDTYRWYTHAFREVGRRDLRPTDEVAAWRRRDPIALFEARLQATGAISDHGIAALREQAKEQLLRADAFADASPFPNPKDLRRDMIAT